MDEKRRKYYKYEKKKKIKWYQKDGSTPDDIIFTDGKVDINFDQYMEYLKNE